MGIFYLRFAFFAGAFFTAVRTGVAFLADSTLYSLYNATEHVYTRNPDTAVINPAIRCPSDAIKNTTNATAKTTV